MQVYVIRKRAKSGKNTRPPAHGTLSLTHGLTREVMNEVTHAVVKIELGSVRPRLTQDSRESWHHKWLLTSQLVAFMGVGVYPEHP